MRIQAFHTINLLLIVVPAYFLQAQTPVISFKNITSRQGLPYPDVNCMLKSRDGFLWFGTGGGLVRYDGSRFVSYKKIKHDPSSLINNVVTALAEAPDGIIICGTRKGLSLLNRSTGKFTNVDVVIPGRDPAMTQLVQNLFYDPSGDTWVFTAAGLLRYNGSGITSFVHDENNPASITADGFPTASICHDSVRQGLWIATLKGLNFYDYRKKTFFSYRNNTGNNPVFDDKAYQAVGIYRETLWTYCHTDTAFVSLHLVTHEKRALKFHPYIGGLKIRPDVIAFDIDPSGNLVFNTWQTPLTYLDAKTGRYTFYPYDKNDPNNIPSPILHRLQFDEKGNGWFLTGSGIGIWSPGNQSFTVHQIKTENIHPEFPTHQQLNITIEDSAGVVWAGSDGEGLFRLDRSKNEFLNFRYESDNLKDNCIFSILPYNQELWLGTRMGIKIFNPLTKQFRLFTDIADSLFNVKTIYWMHQDRHRYFWLCNYATGVYRYNPVSRQYHHFRHVDSIPSSMKKYIITSMLEDRDGDFWFSSAFGISKLVRGDTSFIHYDINTQDTSDLLSPVVLNLFQDSKGGIWMMSDAAGIARLDKRTMKKTVYTDVDGLSSLYVQSMAEDPGGNLWMASSNGIMRWNQSSGSIEKIPVDYGQKPMEFTDIRFLQDGHLLVSNVSSLLVIDPDRIRKTAETSPVLISSFRVFDKLIPMSGDEIKLSYSENFFSIGYSVLEEAYLENIEYAYKLEGVDKNWQYVKGQKFASYTNIPGGHYVFHVKAGMNGNWNEPSTILPLYIGSVYYQTAWFRFLVLFVLFIILQQYFLWRSRKKEMAEAEKAIHYFADSEHGSNVHEILWDVARNVLSKLGFEEGIIYLLKKDSNLLVQTAAFGPKSLSEQVVQNPLEIPMGQGIVGAVAASGRAELIPNTRKDPRYIVDDEHRRSEITVPILYEGKVMGIIDSEHSSKRFFTKNHLRILETVASICSSKMIKAMAEKEVEEKAKSLLEAGKKMAEMRLMALRAQMNPHFIFNSLNAIDNFILHHDAENASLYLNKFARLIRSILNQSDKNEISLKEELDILRNYMDLENLRFEDRFFYTITVDPALDLEETEVSSLLLQPFVENAILHGLHPKAGEKRLSVEIRLRNRNLVCVIEDNGIGRAASDALRKSKTKLHESKGMKMTGERLELLQEEAGTRATIMITDLQHENGSGAGTRVEIVIPIDFD